MNLPPHMLDKQTVFDTVNLAVAARNANFRINREMTIDEFIKGLQEFQLEYPDATVVSMDLEKIYIKSNYHTESNKEYRERLQSLLYLARLDLEKHEEYLSDIQTTLDSV